LKLPALDFTNWCNIIVAKYGDLYWSEELLVSLYEVIHGQKPDIDRSVWLSSQSSVFCLSTSISLLLLLPSSFLHL